MSEVTKEVNLARIQQPQFLTITKLPANQVGFRIVRDDPSAPAVIKKRRSRRSDPLLAITFEAGLSEDDVVGIMNDYGLEGYQIVENDGIYTVVRADVDGVVDASTALVMGIGNGRKAYIAKPATKRSDEIDFKPVGVAAIAFSKDAFETTAECEAWLKRNEIDFSSNTVENTDEVTTYKRSEVKEGTDQRRMQVDTGVSFTVVRDDGVDVPAAYVEVVSESAYGNWGWGQLDFTAAMADIEFCEASREAIYRLESVVDRILFYSELPPAIRKDLVAQAAAQFAAFIGTLLDALPARVVIANRSDLMKEKQMSKKDEQAGQAAQRSEETATAATATATETPATEAPAASTVETFTRADVEAMIAAAVSGMQAKIDTLQAAPAAAPATEVQRTDGVAKADPTVEALAAIMRSVEAVSTAVQTVGDRVGKIESQTTVRTDGGDGKQTTERADVFAGIFSKQPAK